MKTNKEILFLFETDFNDGGEDYHVAVELVINEPEPYYHCRINAIPDHDLFVDENGKLQLVGVYDIEVDLVIDEIGYWDDKKYGYTSWSDTVGNIIENKTMSWKYQ